MRDPVIPPTDSSIDSPRSDDAVLGGVISRSGGSGPIVAGSLVLGGWPAIQQQLQSPDATVRIGALYRLDRAYRQEGRRDLIQMLRDPDRSVQKVAYHLLQSDAELICQQAIQDYAQYQLFEPLRTLLGHDHAVKAVTFGGNLGFSADSMGVVLVWDLATGEILDQIQTWMFAYGLAYDVDRHWILLRTAQGEVVAWNIKTRLQVNYDEDQTLDGLVLPSISAIASTVTIDDQYLLFSNQRNIKVWDKPQAKEIAVLQGHRALVNAISISPDRHFMLSGSEDKTVLLWGIPGLFER
jgi:WD40 repeat protein